MLYEVITRVRKVAITRPKATTTAMERHHWLDSLTQAMLRLWKSKETPVIIGTRPRMVVIAVRMTGRRRVAPPLTTASWRAKPRSRSLLV